MTVEGDMGENVGGAPVSINRTGRTPVKSISGTNSRLDLISNVKVNIPPDFNGGITPKKG